MEGLVLDKAKELFYSYGLKSVSMEDIARNAGVSKKTIYKDFEDKTKLIEHLVADLLSCHQRDVDNCAEIARDPVEEVFLYTQTPFETIALINQAFFYELEKFFPTVWKQVMMHRKQVLLPSIIGNLKKGILLQVYRAELDLSFVAEARVQQILTAFNPRAITDRKVPNRHLLDQLSEFYLQAITTAKGKKLINKYLNVNNEKQF